MARRSSSPKSEAGFFDQRSIEVGDVWDAKLREALRAARVLVSICSPTYLTREYCGKELQVSIERVPAGTQSTAVIPVMWERPAVSQHPAFTNFQFVHKDLTGIYAQEGLYYMMGLKKHDDEYEQFVMKLSRRIVDAGERFPLQEVPVVRPFDQVPNPFSKAAKSSGGLKSALFTYVAGRREEALPAAAERYGSDGREWRPFHPNCPDPVGIIAMEVAARQKLFYKDLPLDPGIVDRIREAEERKDVVIVIVDPWSIRVNTYEQYMRTYDKNNFDNSAVLVAWNSPERGDDPERKQLRAQLMTAFRHHARGKKSIYYVDSIYSQRDLRGAVAKTIAKLRNSLIQSSEAHRGIDDPALADNAGLQGIATDKQPVVTSPGEPGR